MGPESTEFPVFSLLNRDSALRDGFAVDSPHRHVVCGCGDFAPATSEHPTKHRAFAGSWERGHSSIGTGDGEFRADGGQGVAFVSVAKFGGPDSLPIRARGKFEF